MNGIFWKDTLPLACVFLLGCTSVFPIIAQDRYFVLKERFSVSPVPPAPDYQQEKEWAALPWRSDAADWVPPGLKNNQDSASADVFFVHPTSYTSEPNDSFIWNAATGNQMVNVQTDKGSIRYQASVFNGSARVFAPRYRQAHFYAFLTPHPEDKRGALDTAYSDVRRAFLQYMYHWNQGRPLMIASHSQGTEHARRLVQEMIGNTAWKKQLIAAWLVGMPISKDSITTIGPCLSDTQTGCYLSWRTFLWGHEPRWKGADALTICHNPVTWKLDEAYAARSMHKGAVLTDNKVRPKICDAQVHNGYLWIHRPRFPGSRLYRNPNYHVGDYNLFYMDVRQNASGRLNRFLQTH
ncbi:MAG: DUF3089 domain-containing protein [Bacteroidetes bacterium]|nr:DUF3089 domain-containing protein [Bacteroidota bacterium]